MSIFAFVASGIAPDITFTVVLGIGFSIGAAWLLALALASVYRGMLLPWQSRAAGYVMLLGLSLTQILHARFLLGMDSELASRGYVFVVFLQSVGFYCLNKLAELIKLSSHQLSELINTQFEMGFSRLVRRYRVEAAKKMLIDEPRASVLSVGLSVGFTSQSNFYVAFKEFTGAVPGQFRKQSGVISPDVAPT